MRKFVMLLCCSCIFCFAHGQVKFEPGYIIDESGNRQECLVKNIEWANNPSTFQYKLSESGDVKTGTLATVREFGVGEEWRFLKSIVLVDRSSERASSLSQSMEPEFVEETVYLKMLVSGHATLFGYYGKNLQRFYLKIGDHAIFPLVYKQYIDGTRVATNPRFKFQLTDSLKCESITTDDIVRTRYESKSLSKIVDNYNKCMGAPSQVMGRILRKSNFNVGLRAGVSLTSTRLDYTTYSNTNHEFGAKSTFRFGVELEYIPAILKNKWSVLIEPGYFSYKNEENYRLNQVAWIDYKSFELPIGIRHYFYLNERNKIFLNLLFNANWAINSKQYFTSTGEVDVRPTPNFSFGGGANLLDRFSVELRHNMKRQLSTTFANWESRLSSTSLILGVRIF